jgi:hypothetical protein
MKKIMEGYIVLYKKKNYFVVTKVCDTIIRMVPIKTDGGPGVVTPPRYWSHNQLIYYKTGLEFPVLREDVEKMDLVDGLFQEEIEEILNAGKMVRHPLEILKVVEPLVTRVNEWLWDD